MYELNNTIYRNAIEKGHENEMIMFKGNNTLIIYAAQNGYFYIQYIGTKLHKCFTTLAAAVAAAENDGYAE